MERIIPNPKARLLDHVRAVIHRCQEADGAATAARLQAFIYDHGIKGAYASGILASAGS